jgi:hypothetical protein
VRIVDVVQVQSLNYDNLIVVVTVVPEIGL